MAGPTTPIAVSVAAEEAAELPPSALVRQRTRAAWLFLLPTLIAMGWWRAGHWGAPSGSRSRTRT